MSGTIHCPNRGFAMASRTWLAVALCFLVWFMYLKWFAPPPPTPRPSQQVSGPAAPATTAPEIKPKQAGLLFEMPLKSRESFRLSGEKMEVAFSEEGGRIFRIQVNKYRESIRKDAKSIASLDTSASPFSLASVFSDTALKELADGSYQVEKAENRVRFTLTSAANVSIEKEYQISPDSYLMEHKLKLSFPQGRKLDWGRLVIPVGTAALQHDQNDPLRSWEVVAFQNDSVSRTPYGNLTLEEKVLQGNTSWLAFGNRYFATALIHESGINPDIILVGGAQFAGAYLSYPLRLKPDETELVISLKIYSGPKEYNELSKIAGLKGLINYGMFSFIAYPLLLVLNFFYQFVNNYGVAIILLTILVRAIFYPLSLKSYRSMAAMQKLQPQVQALKEKYKDDKERFNREQIALFKAHKVNPAGGCLPMLVQLPVFIALYSVLSNSMELFQAPFFGWINDLSSKDPYYIYPVLMGASMFIQQKLTPTVGMDPMQAKMMLIMPVVFTFLMVNLPSGLTVYIFLSTVLGILQQVAMTKESKKGGLMVAKTSSSTSKG